MKRKNKIFYKILSNSMLPTFKTGDIVMCGKKEPKDIEIGNIIVIDSNFFFNINRDVFFFKKYKGLPLIHRVIRKEKKNGKWVFKTMGDNSPRVDGASVTLEENEEYILVEYDPSKIIPIPESEIIGVVLKKISKLDGKIISNFDLNHQIEYELPFHTFKKIQLKFYFKNKNKSNGYK